MSLSKSLYYDDLRVGQTFVTKGRTVTEADIVAFAALSWDHNRLHTDEEYASGTMFGRRIAHGLLGTVIHTGLSYEATEDTILAFLELTWRFHAPIFIGDTVHVEQAVQNLRETSKPDRGVVTFEKRLVNQRGEAVQSGTTTILLKKRPFDDGES
jgi:acyl dehydratase